MTFKERMAAARKKHQWPRNVQAAYQASTKQLSSAPAPTTSHLDFWGSSSSSSYHPSSSATHKQSTPDLSTNTIADRIALARKAHASSSSNSSERIAAAKQLGSRYWIWYNWTKFYQNSVRWSNTSTPISNTSTSNYTSPVSTHSSRPNISNTPTSSYTSPVSTYPNKSNYSVSPSTSNLQTSGLYTPWPSDIVKQNIAAENQAIIDKKKSLLKWTNVSLLNKHHKHSKTYKYKGKDYNISDPIAKNRNELIARKNLIDSWLTPTEALITYRYWLNNPNTPNTPTPTTAPNVPTLPASTVWATPEQTQLYNDYIANAKLQAQQFADYQARQTALNQSIADTKMWWINANKALAQREQSLQTDQANRDNAQAKLLAEQARNKSAWYIEWAAWNMAWVTWTAAQELANVADKFNIDVRNINSDTAKYLTNVQSQYNSIIRKLNNDKTLTEVDKIKIKAKMDKDLYNMQKNLLDTQLKLKTKFYWDNASSSAASTKAATKSISDLSKRSNKFMDLVNKTLLTAWVTNKDSKYWNNVRNQMETAVAAWDSNALNKIIDNATNDMYSNPTVKNYYANKANKSIHTWWWSSTPKWTQNEKLFLAEYNGNMKNAYDESYNRRNSWILNYWQPKEPYNPPVPATLNTLYTDPAIARAYDLYRITNKQKQNVLYTQWKWANNGKHDIQNKILGN